MTNVLPLRSFEVEGYRAIRHLRLPQLERVNLFVGLNNAGKTSLLEAVQLYSTTTPIKELVDILRERSGFRPTFRVSTRREERTSPADVQAAFDAADSLFHGAYSGKSATIRLGAMDETAGRVEIMFPWMLDGVSDPRGDVDREIVAEPFTPLLRFERGERIHNVAVHSFLGGVGVRLRRAGPRVGFVPAQGLNGATLATLWDRAAELGHAPEVEEALRVIVSDLERVYLLGKGNTRRIVMQMKGITRPIPLANMGDGTNRVFGIALALVEAQQSVLLIDEVENGLHHSVQGEVWSAIFGLAERLDVQVFATTHSWDAVVGFQAAANESDAEGILYRLEREPDGAIYAERYTEEEVAVAADQQIEVR